MVERQIERAKETEAKIRDTYEATLKRMADARRRAQEGQVVMRWADIPWKQCRQGLVKVFLDPVDNALALMGWHIFVQDVRVHSGKHRHQGGISIYAIEGKGYTVVDGVRYDWEAGDLLLLPFKPGGVVHQHFNAEPGQSCRWLGIIYDQWQIVVGSIMEQREDHPDFKQPAGG